MASIQHDEARRLLNVIQEADSNGVLLTYGSAARALGRTEKHSRAVAQMCDLLDAAAVAGNVPLLALVKVRDVDGKINPKAWASNNEPAGLKEAIVARSLSYAFSNSDYSRIAAALMSLQGLGNRAAWKKVRSGFKSQSQFFSQVSGVEYEADGSLPNWTRDELIVALDFYLKHRLHMPDKVDAQIASLSDTIRSIQRALGGGSKDVRLRNVNGVYMKLMNFRRLDPQFTQQGKTGLTRGSKVDEEVWTEFAHDPQRCSKVAGAVKKAAADSGFMGASPKPSIVGAFPDLVEEAAEGRLLTRLHQYRERQNALVKSKKMQIQKLHGALRCDVCAFDFCAVYGDRGEGFIECHHTKPVETLEEGDLTKIEDLALLCANCHRMIHRRRPWLSLDELRRLLRKDNASMTSPGAIVKRKPIVA